MQTIIGSGGSIGIPLAKALFSYTDKVRLVSRNPTKVNLTDELMSLDVYDYSKLETVIAGSEVVYITIGFNYSLKVWRNTWPPFMQAVVDACKKHNVKLVFFDNAYLYAANAIPFMTEESLINPPSEKGKVRQQLHEMIMLETKAGNLQALIARSADFYGPFNKNSALEIMVATNLMKGKKAQVLGDPEKIHTLTYTPDAANATAILGNTPDAFNQIWHVPTTKEKLTIQDWVNLIAKEINVTPKIQKIPSWMLHLIGLFVPVMREFPEMLYQNTQDFIFDSSKFESRFGIMPTTPAEGIHKMMQSIAQKK